MATAQDEGPPDGWLESWRPSPEPAPVPLAGHGSTLHLARDPRFSCPCPMRGLRCGDCMMIAFAPPPFRATPLGWALASGRRLGWRIRQLITER